MKTLLRLLMFILLLVGFALCTMSLANLGTPITFHHIIKIGLMAICFIGMIITIFE